MHQRKKARKVSKNDCYGTCPTCGHVAWHQYKRNAIIFTGGGCKSTVSLFKCSYCKERFGFDLSESDRKEKNDEDWEDILTFANAIDGGKLRNMQQLDLLNDIREIASRHCR